MSFVRGAITPQQVSTHRPSYVNAILIQRGGAVVPGGCSECRRRGFTPFPECRRALGHFGDACGNCKWRDHAARCVVRRDGPADDDDDGDNDPSSDGESDGGGAPAPARRRIAAPPVRRLLLPPGSEGNPIEL